MVDIIQSYKEFMVKGKFYDRKVYDNMIHNGFSVLSSNDDFEIGQPTKEIALEYIDWYQKAYPDKPMHYVYYAHKGDFDLRYVVVYGRRITDE